MRRLRAGHWLMMLAVGAAAPARAQTLETETARLLSRGGFEVAAGVERQASSEGRELAVPIAFEFGLTDALELIVEPVPYTAIRPKEGPDATGPGDLEVTLVYGFLPEGSRRPALAVAGEAKLPTARDALIGTRQTDYTSYLIASKRLGPVDAHANLSYAILGQPPAIRLDPVWGYSMGGVWRPGARYELFGEVLGTTAAIAEGGETENPVVPEAPSGELVGTLGAGRYLHSGFLAYLAVSVDNNAAVQLRPGFEIGRAHV